MGGEEKGKRGRLKKWRRMLETRKPWTLYAKSYFRGGVKMTTNLELETAKKGKGHK